MCARIQIHRWGARKNDDSTSREVAQSKHANPDLVRVTKQLLKSTALDEFRKVARQCKKTHKYLTVPWDDGVGLLPTENYLRYTEEIGEKRREAMGIADEFVKEYTAQWQNGLSDYRRQQEGLGDVFDESDYPEPKYVKEKFGIDVRLYPIPDPNDFRVKVSGDVASTLKTQMMKDFRNDLQQASRVPIIRLHKLVKHLHEMLLNDEARLHASLIGNVQELIEILPTLNIFDDPELNNLIKQTDKTICSVSDMKALKKDPLYRKEVAKSAASILKQMKGYVS